MLEHRAVLDTINEVLDRQHLGNVLAPVPEFRSALDVGVVRLIRFLGAEGQESCRRWTNVSAGEVAHESVLEVEPRVDAVWLKVIQPGASRTL